MKINISKYYCKTTDPAFDEYVELAREQYGDRCADNLVRFKEKNNAGGVNASGFCEQGGWAWRESFYLEQGLLPFTTQQSIKESVMNGKIMKAVVDMNGDWKTGIQNNGYSSGFECLFSDNQGYWATCSDWDCLCSGERYIEGDLTPICTIAEFEEAAAKWKEQQSVETHKVDLSQMYCPFNSPDIEAYKKLAEEQFGSNTLSKLQEKIDWCRKLDYTYSVRVSEDGVTCTKLCWYQHESGYIEFKAPKVNYEELTFGELPRDEKLKLVEHVLDGGVLEYCYVDTTLWSDCSSGHMYLADGIKYRIKHVEPVTEKELFLLEAKHYESIEQMFNSGKFKLVTNDGEE